MKARSSSEKRKEDIKRPLEPAKLGKAYVVYFVLSRILYLNFLSVFLFIIKV